MAPPVAGTRRRTTSAPAGAARAESCAQQLHELGRALLARAPQIIADTIAQTRSSGELVDVEVQARFERVCGLSTPAVARWIGGEGVEVTDEAARESAHVFGEVAARRAASLQEVTRRSVIWRNVMAAALLACARERRTGAEPLARAGNMLQLSLESSLLRMCECFEDERRRTDEALMRREQELAFLATHDPLTELPNRTLILGRLEQVLARARRARDPVAVLFVDLDNFKAINDTLGHRAGDELLQAVAARLRRVVTDEDALGRLGGDEFVAIACGPAAEDGTERLAEQLHAALAAPFRLGAGPDELTVTASVGIASGSGCAEELLREADIAMYRAKSDGKNRHALFSEEMQLRMQDRMELEMDLRAALAGAQFRLVYQPSIRLADMSVAGAEALLRWDHPTRGVLQPAEFIPVLEETGLIVDVGRWVLAEACRQAAAWRDAGLELAIAVNVSARQLDSDELVRDVAGVLRASGLPAGELTIEVTETALMRSVEETAARLAAIKRLGVRIAIDDFGTGYSSLAHLKRFRVDSLKIDRSFVRGQSRGQDGHTLIRALVRLGRALAIDTHAEGIETQEELSLVRREGCQSGQGFLFARPLAADDVEDFFARWPVAAAA